MDTKSSKSGSKCKTISRVMTESSVITNPSPKSITKTESKTKTVTKTDFKTKIITKSNTVTVTEFVSKPKSKSRSKPESKPEPEPESRPESKPEPKSEYESEPEPEPESEPESESESNAKPKSNIIIPISSNLRLPSVYRGISTYVGDFIIEIEKHKQLEKSTMLECQINNIYDIYLIIHPIVTLCKSDNKSFKRSQYDVSNLKPMYQSLCKLSPYDLLEFVKSMSLILSLYNNFSNTYIETTMKYIKEDIANMEKINESK